jgi:hypothetical protein
MGAPVAACELEAQGEGAGRIFRIEYCRGQREATPDMIDMSTRAPHGWYLWLWFPPNAPEGKETLR